MKIQDVCPFCNARRNGPSWFACGTDSEPDENGDYNTGLRCDRDCFARTVTEQADHIAKLFAAALSVQHDFGNAIALYEADNLTMQTQKRKWEKSHARLRNALNSKGDA